MTEQRSLELTRMARPPLPQSRETHHRSSTQLEPESGPQQYCQHSVKQLMESHHETQPINPEELLRYFEEYKPQSKFDMQLLGRSDKLRLKRYKGCHYYGEFVNEKRHGLGVMVYLSGRLYEGSWEGDIKHGQGYQKFTNGSHYTGHYVNGKPQGYGSFKWPNGETYEGQWVNGQKHGSGTWAGGRGDSYIGEWKFGVADGFGVHTWINGDKYEGEFRTCLKHGEGVELFANGDKYEGSYVNGKPSGYGEYYWSNGSSFKGHFKNGLRHGKGIWKKGEGESDVYEGEYSNDKKCGYGVFTWAGGNIYKGNYFEDLRHGYGEMLWSDGTSYKGQWVRGVQHGQGEVVETDGYAKKGNFKQNVAIIEEEQEQIKVNESSTVETKSFRTRLSTSANKSRTLMYSQQKVQQLKPIPQKKLRPPVSSKSRNNMLTTTLTNKQPTFVQKSIDKIKNSRRGSLQKNATNLASRSPCARCANRHSKDKCHGTKDPKQPPQYYLRSSRLIRTTNNNSTNEISGSINLNMSTTSKLSSINRKRLSMFQTTQTQMVESTKELQPFTGGDDEE